MIAATGPYGRTLTYAHDTASGRMDLRWPDAWSVRYASDALGRLTAVVEQGTNLVLATYDYDELSRRKGILRPNGSATNSVTNYTYDAQQRLGSLSHDLAGTAQDVTYNYTYNAAGELRGRTISNSSYALARPGLVKRSYHAFPAAGSAPGGNGLNQYGRVEPNPNLLSYDLNGNLTQDSSPGRLSTFGYDSEGRLTSANGTSLVYDATGRLAEWRGGTDHIRFFYDGADLVGEYDAVSGILLKRYVHGPGADEPLVMYEGSARTWFYGDERGSIVALANETGVGIALNRYGAFGEPEPDAGVTGRFGYTGQVWLPEAGLYHYKARAYSPWLGRFMQPDPIGEQGGMNLYAYVANNPINYVDPNGLFKIGGGGTYNQVCTLCNATAYYNGSEIVVQGNRLGAQMQVAARAAQAAVAQAAAMQASTMQNAILSSAARSRQEKTINNWCRFGYGLELSGKIYGDTATAGAVAGGAIGMLAGPGASAAIAGEFLAHGEYGAIMSSAGQAIQNVSTGKSFKTTSARFLGGVAGGRLGQSIGRVARVGTSLSPGARLWLDEAFSRIESSIIGAGFPELDPDKEC